MNRLSRHLPAACVVLCIALLWLYPLATMRLAAQWDAGVHLRWASQFHTALLEGWLLPRWAHASLHGLGDPTFFYYQPLFYYLTSVLALMGISPQYGLVLSGVAIYCLLGLVVYRFLAARYSAGKAAVGTIFVLVSPSTFFLASQMSAFPWVLSFPFSVLFVLESIRERPRVTRLAVLIGLVCMSHLLSAMMTLLCTALARCVFAFPGRATWKGLLVWGSGVMLGFGLVSFFLFPAVTQLDLISPTGWTDPTSYDWRKSFAFPVVTFFQHGLKWFGPQLPLPGLVLLMLVLTLLPTKLTPSPARTVVRRLAIVALAALALSTELAYPLYEYFTPLHKLQFPYRFIFLATVIATIALAMHLNEGAWSCWSKPVRAIAIVLFAAYAGQLALLQWKLIKEGVVLADMPTIMAASTGQPEYIPAVRGPDWERYVQDGKLDGECRSLGIACAELQQRTHTMSVVIETPKSVNVSLPIFAFPAWRPDVDGRPQPLLVDKSTGLIQVNLPPGRHTVSLQWVRLPSEITGMWISAVSLCLLAGILLVGRRMRHASPADETRSSAVELQHGRQATP